MFGFVSPEAASPPNMLWPATQDMQMSLGVQGTAQRGPGWKTSVLVNLTKGHGGIRVKMFPLAG